MEEDQLPKLIVGILTWIFLCSKVYLHKYLDKKNGYPEKSTTPNMMDLHFYIPYYDKVSPETEKMKKVCNVLWVMSIVSLIVLLAI